MVDQRSDSILLFSKRNKNTELEAPLAVGKKVIWVRKTGTVCLFTFLVPHWGALMMSLLMCFAVHADGDCWASSDCSPGQCCIRPTGSSHSFCHDLRQPGESCRRSVVPLLGISEDRRVYTDLCPCTDGHICRELGTGWVHFACSLPHGAQSTKEALRLRRSFRRSILQAVLNKRAASVM